MKIAASRSSLGSAPGLLEARFSCRASRTGSGQRCECCLETLDCLPFYVLLESICVCLFIGQVIDEARSVNARSWVAAQIPLQFSYLQFRSLLLVCEASRGSRPSDVQNFGFSPFLSKIASFCFSVFLVNRKNLAKAGFSRLIWPRLVTAFGLKL